MACNKYKIRVSIANKNSGNIAVTYAGFMKIARIKTSIIVGGVVYVELEKKKITRIAICVGTAFQRKSL